MDSSFSRAIDNIVHHGDTDIFPFPIENLIIFDQKIDIVALLKSINADFDAYIIGSPPANYGALSPVGYTGFRWATQIDPVWNAYFLALVIEISDKIENARMPTSMEAVYSYRLNGDPTNPDLFDRRFGWRSFIERAVTLSSSHQFVVSCDISEFYPRLNHHRLDNALRQLPNADDCRNKIMGFLSNFSETYSFGLPVGGPASRILSELTLNQIDRLLYQRQIPFCRFADDFYLFADSEAEAFKSLVFLSEILHRNQGLQLQKTKTRIMSSSEFARTNPLTFDVEESNHEGGADLSGVTDARASLFRLSLHFDPYSPTANEDYERLRDEIDKFPILDILKTELAKSRINVSLTRKLIGTLQYIQSNELNDAARTLVDNVQLLYPVFFGVLSALKSIFPRLSPDAQYYVEGRIRALIEQGSPAMSVDLNLQYAIRLLSALRTEESVSLMTRLYESTNSIAIRRDIILAMVRWREWIWLSDRRPFFRSMSPMERRAYIMASYVLKDEGQHWRDHTKKEFSDFEIIVRNWIAERINRPNWELPL